MIIPKMKQQSNKGYIIIISIIIAAPNKSAKPLSVTPKLLIGIFLTS
jgi:hypothetical protein